MRPFARKNMRQRGIALITALVVVAIAAGLAAAMIWETGLDTRRTATLVDGDQAAEYALGVEAWAEVILARQAKKNGSITALNQIWAQQLPPLPVDGGEVQGKIEDLQGRFNINNVSLPQGLAQFRLLLQALGQDPMLADNVAAWFGSSAALQSDAGDDYYTRLQPPYISGRMPMQSISELLLVKGITPAVYAQISPYLCALPLAAGTPTPTKINLNTASGPVIQSLNPHISQDIAAQVIGERGSAPLTATPQALTAATINPGNVAYDSSYFLVTITAQIGTTHVTLYSLLFRNGTAGVTALRRSFGTL